LDLLRGVLDVVRLLEVDEVRVVNSYARAVTFEGNRPAQELIKKVFEECDRKWRGIGNIPMSGWGLRKKYAAFDAERRFDVSEIHSEESSACMAGQILQGLLKPTQCPAYGTLCTPQHPLGATMVSSEGACAAYYHYNKADLLSEVSHG
jgi:hydrogenase expression/formation protein HypD